MVSLEQVKLLESKVTRMIEYITKVTDENAKLKEKLDSYEKRTGELEILFQRFKDDQGRIEDGILSALDLLNQFEDALGSKLFEDKLSPESKLSGGVKSQEPKAAEESAAPQELTATEIPDDEPFPEEDDDQAVSGAELDIF